MINKSNLGANVHGLYLQGGWVRSGYGVCKSQIKDMANTLSVVAGLLATITFAAAFQVSSGFSGDSGSPVLVQRAAFKAFMIFNSFAMCGSMTVLFFLLWVMQCLPAMLRLHSCCWICRLRYSNYPLVQLSYLLRQGYMWLNPVRLLALLSSFADFAPLSLYC